MTNEEKVELLKEHFSDGLGGVSLRGIDFGNIYIDFSNIKARYIDNSRQEVERIIENNDQKAKEIIRNNNQEAKDIVNIGQEAKELILNQRQRALKIDNLNQEAKKIYG